MRIFHSETGDPMVLDRELGLHATGVDLDRFVAGTAIVCSFSAETTGSAEPYQEFLVGLRVEKVDAGAPAVRIDERWLELKATTTDLQRLSDLLVSMRDGEHTHFHASPVSPIFEADDSWPGFQ
jgi:hypothetical protein